MTHFFFEKQGSHILNDYLKAANCFKAESQWNLSPLECNGRNHLEMITSVMFNFDSNLIGSS